MLPLGGFILLKGWYWAGRLFRGIVRGDSNKRWNLEGWGNGLVGTESNSNILEGYMGDMGCVGCFPVGSAPGPHTATPCALLQQGPGFGSGSHHRRGEDPWWGGERGLRPPPPNLGNKQASTCLGRGNRSQTSSPPCWNYHQASTPPGRGDPQASSSSRHGVSFYWGYWEGR